MAFEARLTQERDTTSDGQLARGDVELLEMDDALPARRRSLVEPDPRLERV
jgi:hypothetical protein